MVRRSRPLCTGEAGAFTPPRVTRAGSDPSNQAGARLVRSARQRRLAGRLELIARQPRGQRVAIGDLDAEREPELIILDHAVEVPVRPDLVARLVVAGALEVLDLLAAPALGAADEVEAGAEVDARHAGAREAELIRAVE